MNPSTLALPLPVTPATATGSTSRAPLLPRARISVRTAIWSVLLGISLTAPFMIIGAYFPPSETVRAKMNAIPFHPLAFLVASGFIGPVLEEIVYRGFFQGILRRYSPVWVAIVVPSVVFAATHIIPAGWGYINAFPIACLFAWLVLRTGSLAPGLLCHCTFNITAGLALTPIFNLAEKHLDRATGASFNPVLDLFPVWWIALSLALTVSALVMIRGDTATRPAAH
ncbi:MAG TPA: CPBP family intramembrane glutamic endopeptidase [Opitutaceae bacterium]|nr:CPBP family intramembrane glutamic endopeptidase [Opitutaceae bacterium]